MKRGHIKWEVRKHQVRSKEVPFFGLSSPSHRRHSPDGRSAGGQDIFTKAIGEESFSKQRAFIFFLFSRYIQSSSLTNKGALSLLNSYQPARTKDKSEQMAILVVFFVT